jgi:hypothetical protein
MTTSWDRGQKPHPTVQSTSVPAHKICTVICVTFFCFSSCCDYMFHGLPINVDILPFFREKLLTLALLNLGGTQIVDSFQLFTNI